MYNILIAEDDNDIAKLLQLYFEGEGYTVYSVENGNEALDTINNKNIHLAVLDIMMPWLNGLEVTKKLRSSSNIPIIIISAKDMDVDKILGLSLGADDYLTKPFNPLEVMARVKSALRRAYELSENNIIKEDILKNGDLEINLNSATVKKNNEEISLTITEYKILVYLMKSRGRIFTKEQIWEHINGTYFDGDENTVMVHISKLRGKIEEYPQNPVYIKTVRGLGYKIDKIKK
ncbi:response regulator transcription factor [Terrisporobacter sp.]|uniref:response regulator transcription factor n=1 Tax=Terrisporobacter sp. TaxID=1965305 RepID=UPI002FCAD046